MGSLSLVPKLKSLQDNHHHNPNDWAMSLEHPASTQRREKKKQKEEEEEEEEEEKARCEWDFSLRTVVSSNCSGGGAISDTVGVIEFDPSDQIIATGGIARKIRIYRLPTLLHDVDLPNQGTLLDHTNACEYYICTPAKLSSLRWKPESNGCIIGSGDYDGVVTEYNLEQRVPIFERDEHGGRRVWSLDYSHWLPAVGASGSDDGTVQVWDTRCDGAKCVAMVHPSESWSPVCCVEFDPFTTHFVGLACADRNGYTYDIRRMSSPVTVLQGHEKTVSYVRFLGEGMLVSAGTDGCLKLWDLGQARAIRTYRGHDNVRNFVGLSVWRNGGLFGCGSETNQVFVYDKRWGDPIWVHGLEETMGRSQGEGRFVSSVCWRQFGEEECTLVAGCSDGTLQVFSGKRKSSMTI